MTILFRCECGKLLRARIPVLSLVDDELAGKPNTMRNVPIIGRAALSGAFLVAPFVVLAFLPDAWPARIAIAVNFLWPTIYSVPFIRLKERGYLGVLSDAAGSRRNAGL